MTLERVRSQSFETLGASPLFRDYVAQRESAASFYAHRLTADGRADAARLAADAATRRGTRDIVADVIVEQNASWGVSDSTLAMVDQLRRPDAVAVVTGQQLGLFGGPLYTVYKARTAVRRARQLHEATGWPAVPVFWLADEDHDFAEIQHASFARGEETLRATYDDGLPPDVNRGAVGRLVLDKRATETVLRQLDEALPEGPYRQRAMEIASQAYVPGRSMRDAFARLLARLVPDIVLMSADDARLKRLALPLFEQEATSWSRTFEVLSDRSEALVEAGYHAQVGPSPLNLFRLTDRARVPLDPAGEEVEMRGTEEAMSASEFEQLVRQSPESISPNVVLRPLLQDTLLPTAAYVAGPGEAAYFAQLEPVYEAFDVPMPVIEPRLSLTIVDPGVAKVLDRYDLDLAAIRADVDALWRRLALDASDVDLEHAFGAARGSLDSVFESLTPDVTAVDTELARALGAARQKSRNALDRLLTKTVRLEKRNHDVVRQRLARAHAALWPGAPQERVVGPLQVVARLGVEGMSELIDGLPLDASVHHVVWT
ncbi:MAG: bacillithiol biosynthesis cysteine-adding enzyme BshC [Bacteroidota bacterium]